MMQEWFKKAKLGIFIHYGIYAVKGISESWSFYNGGISYEDYMSQLDGFTGKNFDAKKWAKLFKHSGANYVVLTSKHHDGVALFDTKYSDLNTVKKTPAKRDFIKEYTEAIRNEGMKVGIYYSHIDWSDPRYPTVFAEGSKPEDAIRQKCFSSPQDGVEKPELWEEFLQFNRNQMTELMTNYGTVDLLWFDGDWERSAKQWRMKEFVDYLHKLNPNVVINSRVNEFGDYKTPEQALPVSKPEGVWEFCTTMNDSWGYYPTDLNYKTTGQVIRIFCECISKGGNLLLDVGPKEDGTLDPKQENILLELGDWVKRNESAIFETQSGIDPKFFAGGSTLSQDKKTLYLFVYDKPDECICLKGLCNKIKKITMLGSQKELRHQITGGAPWFEIPGTTWIFMDKEDMDKYATVIKIELEDEIRLYNGEGQPITQN